MPFRWSEDWYFSHLKIKIKSGWGNQQIIKFSWRTQEKFAKYPKIGGSIKIERVEI